MSEISLDEKCFYLGFNKETGELVHVVPPNGSVLRLDPRQIKLISLGLPCRDEYIDENDSALKEVIGYPEKQKELILKRLEDFNDLIKENALPSRLLTFVDKPESSPCGGSCGGVPFIFC
jgi:hypothetical protein